MSMFRHVCVALAAVVVLLLVAVFGAGFEDWLNLYW